MDVFEKLKSGEPVDMLSPEYRPAIDELRRADLALFRLNHAEPTPENMAKGLDELFDGHDHSGLAIMTPCQIDFPKQLTIGKHVFINHSFTAMSIGGVTLEDNVQIGPHVTIVTDNSGSDEYGQYRGGQAGDQTGTEWRMRSWYNRPWSCVLRYPDQAVALKLAQLGIDAALNDKIGYDQSQNRTYLKQLKAVGWEPSRITVACEADCSAGVCANITAAGYLLGIDALKNHTGTYTGNMRSALRKAGFQVLTDSKYLTGGDYLLPGDMPVCQRN